MCRQARLECKFRSPGHTNCARRSQFGIQFNWTEKKKKKKRRQNCSSVSSSGSSSWSPSSSSSSSRSSRSGLLSSCQSRRGSLDKSGQPLEVVKPDRSNWAAVVVVVAAADDDDNWLLVKFKRRHCRPTCKCLRVAVPVRLTWPVALT